MMTTTTTATMAINIIQVIDNVRDAGVGNRRLELLAAIHLNKNAMIYLMQDLKLHLKKDCNTFHVKFSLNLISIAVTNANSMATFIIRLIIIFIIKK